MSRRSTRDADERLVEAHIVARLLGIRLLTIDASVIVVPGRLNGRPAGERFAPHAIGAGLAAAERLLGDGAASLAAARSGGDDKRPTAWPHTGSPGDQR